MSRKNKTRLAIETLESREVMSVTKPWFDGRLLVVPTDNNPTAVTVSASRAGIQIRDVGTGRSWTFATRRVERVEFQGGAGNDRFVNLVAKLPVNAFGFGGNDHLEGYNGADYLNGGDGNDKLLGYGGNDELAGGEGDDQLNGGSGADNMSGDGGNDTIVAIDNTTADSSDGGFGSDTVWVDGAWDTTDVVANQEAADRYQIVDFFANGADRTLNGDRIADPRAKAGTVYKSFRGRPLFGAAGPKATDVIQGTNGDCWLMAHLSAMAVDAPDTLRQSVVDFNDGTYGVRLGDSFYRVDGDLPVKRGTNTPAYAGLGTGGSLWVAVVEKAYTHHRRGENSYASIESGWASEAAQAFGGTDIGDYALSDYGSAAELANAIYTVWNGFQTVTLGFTGGVAAGAPLVNEHMYTVYTVQWDAAGTITSFTLRNPWGYDGAGNDGNRNDGLVTVTPDQIYNSIGRINFATY